MTTRPSPSADSAEEATRNAPGTRPRRVPQAAAGHVPNAALTITLDHRVGFFETDGMGIVHHSNYLRFCENARVVWLEIHDKSYPEWIEMGLHFAVTHAELDYRHASRFDDILEVTTWLEWVRGASLAMAYAITCGETLIATGRTEHASVNTDGRVRRIPKQDRERLKKLAANTSKPAADE